MAATSSAVAAHAAAAADATEEPEEKAQDPPPLSRQQSFLQGVPHSPQGGCCALFLDSHAVYHGLEDDPDEPAYRPTSLAQKLFLILEDPNYNCTAQCDLGVPRCRGAFTPSTRVVSRRGGRGWFLF